MTAAPVTACRDTRLCDVTDAAAPTLEHLRLDGALFFRSELSEPFELESTPLALADALVPGADRLTLFHIVASGSCWVAMDDAVRYWADAGDVVVLPYADHYVMGGEGAAECVSILSLIDPLPWSEMPFLRYGGGGRRTEMVCGYMHSPTPSSTPHSGHCHRSSSCGCRAVQPRGGSRPASTMRSQTRRRSRTCRPTRSPRVCPSSC